MRRAPEGLGARAAAAVQRAIEACGDDRARVRALCAVARVALEAELVNVARAEAAIAAADRWARGDGTRDECERLAALVADSTPAYRAAFDAVDAAVRSGEAFNVGRAAVEAVRAVEGYAGRYYAGTEMLEAALRRCVDVAQRALAEGSKSK